MLGQQRRPLQEMLANASIAALAAGQECDQMQQNATGWWTPTRDRAALLVWEDRLRDREIAAELGIDKSTLERWKQRPEFRERLREHQERCREELWRIYFTGD